MKVIKNHVSLNGKIIHIDSDNNGFWMLSLRARTEQCIKQTSKWYQNPSPNPWNINAESTLEKMIQKHRKSVNKSKGSQQPSITPSKIDREVWNEKIWLYGSGGVSAADAKEHLQINNTLRELPTEIQK